MNVSKKSVLLLGATGLVGGECLKLLATNPLFDRIVVLTRRPYRAVSDPSVVYHQVDFDDPASFSQYLNVNTVICALGTTIKKAGSQEAFRRVDFEYPMTIAKLALEAGASHFLLVTSTGANANSRIFYSRVKGELENAVSKLGYPALSIFRPSLLLGPREEKRIGESISQKLFGSIRFLIPKSVRPVHATEVAAVIIEMAQSGTSGMKIIENAGMV